MRRCAIRRVTLVSLAQCYSMHSVCFEVSSGLHQFVSIQALAEARAMSAYTSMY